MFNVYVLHNAKVHKIYIGQTSNLKARLNNHNLKLGNHYTAKFEGEWKMIYKEDFSTRSEAIKLEKQLKSHQGRAYISKYIPG